MERDIATDQGMVLGCMAVLRSAGWSKQRAVPYYAKLLDHHGLRADDFRGMTLLALPSGYIPTQDRCRAHLTSLFPELRDWI